MDRDRSQNAAAAAAVGVKVRLAAGPAGGKPYTNCAMNCPNCGQEQHDTVTCGSCGIYFTKFRNDKGSRSSRRHAEVRPERHTSGFGWSAIALTAIVSATFGGHFARGQSPARASAPPVQSPATTALAQAVPVSFVQPATAPPAPQELLQGLAAQVAKAAPARNAIETARNATVFIDTGWGFGSGLIIDSACHVITNRHVVDSESPRPTVTALAPAGLRTSMTADELPLRAHIEAQIQLRQALAGQPGTNLQVLELDEHIQGMQQALADMAARRGQDVGGKTEGGERSGFTVTLIDGTRFSSLHAVFSDRMDLALFQLPANHCPHLVRGDSARLAQGERLYTIGNPSGLRYSVTSGVFSGERGSGEERVLQTDAPINQGNSGGPLVTENGRVVGINSKVLSGAQGIGFAIPIEAVYQEFAVLR